MSKKDNNNRSKKDGIKLQKFLAEAGFGARRKIEQELIQKGRVTVNGRIAHIGQRIDPDVDDVRVDGERVRPQQKIYVLFHKPSGYLCSHKSLRGMQRIYDILPPEFYKLHFVGRLDFKSEGLLILTNDGDLTSRLTSRKYHIPREYDVKLRGKVADRLLGLVARGVKLEDGFARPLDLYVLKFTRSNTWVRIVVDEGRNRLVRRLFEHFGMIVVRLKRVSYGPLRLEDLPPGAYRFLDEDEVRALKEAVNLI